MKHRIWIAAGVLAALAIHHCQATDDTVAPAPHSATTRASLAALIAQLPTPVRLRHHAIYVETGTLGFSGVAKDDDGEPIAGATITLGPRATTSAEDGRFAFSHLGPGTYLVTGEKVDAFGEDTIALAAGEDASLSLRLRVGPTLHLHVIDHDGVPVPDATVDLAGVSTPTAITDATGTVVMRGLVTDSLVALVHADGHANGREDIDMGDDPHGTIERTITLADGAELAGVVVDEQDRPVAAADVDLRLRTWREIVKTDATGHWHVDEVPAGKLAASASADAFYDAPDIIIEHDGSTPKSDVTIHVTRGATASGIVVDERGLPLPEVSVVLGRCTGKSDAQGHFEITGIRPGLQELAATTQTLAAVPHKYEVALHQKLELRVVMIASSIAGIVVDPRGAPVAQASVLARCHGDDCTGGAFATSDDHGAFDLGGVPPGMYELAVQRDKDRAPYPAGVLMASGTHGVKLVVAALGDVTGRVLLAGQPVAYYGVNAALEPDPSFGSYPRAIHAANGEFALPHLAPGLYALQIAGPTFATKVIEHVRVPDGGAFALGDVAVEQGRTVRGRVVDERGAPVENALVTLACPGPWRGNATLEGMSAGTRVAHTASDGSYELAGVTEADNLVLEAALGTQRTQTHPLLPTDRVVDLVVVRTGTVLGHVEHVREHGGRIYLMAADQTFFATDTDPAGDFEISQVAPGDYTVSLLSDATVPPQNVHVDGGATTTVAFSLNPEPIDLVVHAPCEIIQLRNLGGDYLTGEDCVAATATFADVMPGAYRVCTSSERCAEISVTPGPPHQEVAPHFPDPPAPPDPLAPEDEAADPSAP